MKGYTQLAHTRAHTHTHTHTHTLVGSGGRVGIGFAAPEPEAAPVVAEPAKVAAAVEEKKE